VFLLCRQEQYVVCRHASKHFFQNRCPLRTTSFITQARLFQATPDVLEENEVTPLLDYVGTQEVSGRLSIAAVSLFYSAVRYVDMN
jgi:hypothetical protein